MERCFDLCRCLRVPAMVCINKCDINPEMSEQIKSFAEQNNLKYVGSVPYDREVTAAMVAAKPLVVHSSGAAATAVREVWKAVVSHMERLLPHLHYPAAGPEKLPNRQASVIG